jgi:hypothetical protein
MNVQNVNLAANCNTRGRPAPVIRPKSALFMFVWGLL